MSHVSSQKARDKAVVLNVVRTFGPISRMEIHELTKLRHSTISQLTRELLDEEALAEAGLSDNPLGRKQILLQVREDREFVLGIEFDAAIVSAAVMDLKPRIRSLIKEETYLEGGIPGLIAQIERCARRTVDQAGLALERVRGIGFADIGLVDRRTGVSLMSSQIPFWRDVPVAGTFQEILGVPVWVDNATRCRGRAERHLGAGRGSDDMVYVEYGSGIGSALFAGGRALDGHRTSAGEIGHMRVTDEGTPCQCGSFGCLEAVASVGALAARFQSVYREGMQSLAIALAGEPARVTGWHVLQAARQGDKVCSALAGDMARQLGLALANVVNLLAPAAIVLDQRLEVAGPDLLEQVGRVIRLQALSHLTEDLEIRYGRFGDEAGLLGAGLLVLDHLFAIPELKPPRFLVDPEAAAAFAENAREAPSPAG